MRLLHGVFNLLFHATSAPQPRSKEKGSLALMPAKRFSIGLVMLFKF